MSAKVNAIPPAHHRQYPIALGTSFFQHQQGQRPTGFVNATYRFKPSSMDQSKPGNIIFNDKQAILQFDRKQTNNTNNSQKRNKVEFSGPSDMASNREFFLWFDASSQKIVMERCGVQIKHLNHNRQQQPMSNVQSYTDKSKDRLKQMTERHKKKTRLKNKRKTKKNTKIVTKPMMAKSSSPKNVHSKTNSDTNSTRSVSQSISPPTRQMNMNDGHSNNRDHGMHSNVAMGHNNGCHPPSIPNQSQNVNVNAAQFRSNGNNGSFQNDHHQNNGNHGNGDNGNGNNNGPTPLFGFATWDDSEDEDEDEDLF